MTTTCSVSQCHWSCSPMPVNMWHVCAGCFDNQVAMRFELGVGGSGRPSLSRLANFMSEYDIFQIDVVKGYGMTEFKDDIKTYLMKCGNEQK